MLLVRASKQSVLRRRCTVSRADTTSPSPSNISLLSVLHRKCVASLKGWEITSEFACHNCRLWLALSVQFFCRLVEYTPQIDMRGILIIAGMPHQVLAERFKCDGTLQDAQAKRRGERLGEPALRCCHQLRSGQHENQSGKARRRRRNMSIEPDLLP